MKLDIFFRAHTVIPEKNRKNALNPPKWSEYVLVFDTETTTDTSQSLTLGAYRFCRLTADSQYECLEEGLFHAEDLDSRSVEIMRNYLKGQSAGEPQRRPRQAKALFSRRLCGKGALGGYPGSGNHCRI